MNCSILWLRRDLRLEDHKPLHYAVEAGLPIQPIFIFDKNILSRFANKYDRRVSFIAETLLEMEKQLKKNNGNILIFYGDPEEIVPRVSKILEAKNIYAGKDFEPKTIERDRVIAEKLGKYGKNLSLFVDHLIMDHRNIGKKDGSPFKLYSPFARIWREQIKKEDFADYSVDIKNKFLQINKNQEKELGNIDYKDLKDLLEKIGYNYQENPFFPVSDARLRLDQLVKKRLADYEIKRNFPGEEGTSMISPYLRFGLISIRECYRKIVGKRNSDRWLIELIWREFYSMILARFPESEKLEFLTEFRGLLWNDNQKAIDLYKEGLTGYPLVDAALRQLKEIGWMHNRCRMVVASFLSKNMYIDWRVGEEHFSQYLMDYELASNLGGWQWAASVGANAPPYFRSFNPFLQSEKFDKEGKYIRHYVKELKDLPDKLIHRPDLYRENHGEIANYPDYLVKYEFNRGNFHKFFKEKKQVSVDYDTSFRYDREKKK